MSGDICHGIFYQFDGEAFAHTIKDFFFGRRYNMHFSLHELQDANITNISNPGVFILLLTPDSYDFIKFQKHLDLNAIFPNPEFSVVLLFHVEKTKTEITTLLSSRIRDFSKWMILEYSSLSTLGIDIMGLVERLEEKCARLSPQQKCKVWPPEGVKSREQVILIFLEPVDDDSKVKFIQEWDGLKGMAERLNPMTFCFTIGDVEPGERKIEVLVNDTSFGRVVVHVLRVEPKREEITMLLHNVINPVELLCQCLHIAPSTLKDLDKGLMDLLSNNTTSVSHVFDGLNWKRFGVSSANYELPTLLHFGAKYGFKLFCTELLRLPGGKHALKMKNKDGLLPYQIAQKKGFEHLALVLQNSENGLERHTFIGDGELECLHTLHCPVIEERTSNVITETHIADRDKITHPLDRRHRMTEKTKPVRVQDKPVPEIPVSIQFGKIKRKERHYESIDDE